MKRWSMAYLGTALAMCALDFVWLAWLSPDIYQQALGSILLSTPRMVPVVLFYLIYVAGVVVFGVKRGLEADRVSVAAGYSALFGFVAYATYDLTNLATLKQWPVGLSLIDMAWGTCVSAAAAAGGKALMDWAAPV